MSNERAKHTPLHQLLAAPLLREGWSFCVNEAQNYVLLHPSGLHILVADTPGNPVVADKIIWALEELLAAKVSGLHLVDITHPNKDQVVPLHVVVLKRYE